MEVGKVKIKIKEYDEILCHKCKSKIKVLETLKMIDGYKGICTCPECGYRNKVVKTRPADDDFNVLETGQRIRKDPKVHMSKKERRRIRDEQNCLDRCRNDRFRL